MKLKNSTDFSDAFLRRMVSWCCRQLELPVNYIREAQFRNRSRNYSGHAWPYERRMCVSVASKKEVYADQAEKPNHHRFCEVRKPNEPIVYRVFKDVPRERFDIINDLVRVTAHECAHLMLSRFGRSLPADMQKPVGRRLLKNGGSEQQTGWHENHLMELFAADRDALFAEWSKADEKPVREAVPVAEKRQLKILAALERWQRKLKLAKTKVKKLTAKARYYERKAAFQAKGSK